VLRAFDVLARAEQRHEGAAHPRYHFEMALLRWMHVRKLVPLTELLDQMGGGGAPRRRRTCGGAAPPASGRATVGGARPARPRVRRARPRPRLSRRGRPRRPACRRPAPNPRIARAAARRGWWVGHGLKDALLAEIRSGKSFFYNMVVAQAQSIDVSAEGVVFAFLPTHRSLRERFEETRPWIEAAAERLAGRKMSVRSIQVEGGGAAPSVPPAPRPTTVRGAATAART
jgi:hypothetical protein